MAEITSNNTKISITKELRSWPIRCIFELSAAQTIPKKISSSDAYKKPRMQILRLSICRQLIYDRRMPFFKKHKYLINEQIKKFSNKAENLN